MNAVSVDSPTASLAAQTAFFFFDIRTGKSETTQWHGHSAHKNLIKNFMNEKIP